MHSVRCTTLFICRLEEQPRVVFAILHFTVGAAYLHVTASSRLAVASHAPLQAIFEPQPQQVCCLQMLAALPAGCLADNYRRDYVLKGAAVLGAIAAATLAIALLYQLPVPSLFGACALLGMYTGFNNAPLEALFADCISRGRRQVPAPLLVSTHECSVNAYLDMSCRPADTLAEGCSFSAYALLPKARRCCTHSHFANMSEAQKTSEIEAFSCCVGSWHTKQQLMLL